MALVLALLAGAACHGAELTLRVDPERDAGALPSVYRPSVMLSWAEAKAVAALMALPGRLGTLRVTLEPLLADSTNLEDLRARLSRGGGAGMKALAGRAERVVITVARTPRWLASSASEEQAGEFGFTRREASPPRQPEGFEALGYEIVRAINVAHGISPLYEFWNEPESRSFWSGSSAQLFQIYDAFARGARRADPKAKVGGIAVGGWKEPRAGEAGVPMLQAFIQHAGRGVRQGTAAPDFISWHNFVKSPGEGWEGAHAVREWLRQAGLPELPQLVTEWNLWRTFPQWLDPSRDTAQGAALLLAAHEAIADADLAGHTIAALQDFNPTPRGQAFPGDFGLVTRSPMLKKASFCAMQMLSHLEGRAIAVAQPDVQLDAAGIGVVASAGPERIVVLVHRYPINAEGAYLRSLRRSGFPLVVQQTGVSRSDIAAFNARKAPLPASASASARAALERARAVWESVRAGGVKDVTLNLAFGESKAAGKYRIFRMDEKNCDPGGVYRNLRGKGTGHEAAVTEARQHESLKAVEEGSGALPPLAIPGYGAVLVEIERAARR